MSGHLFLILSLVLFSKLFKTADNNAGVGAIVDENRGRSHPGLQIIQTKRDVLRVGAVEHPDFSVSCWLGHTMTIVMEKHTFVSGAATETSRQSSDLQIL